jgi:hypothetical protein
MKEYRDFKQINREANNRRALQAPVSKFETGIESYRLLFNKEKRGISINLVSWLPPGSIADSAAQGEIRSDQSTRVKRFDLNIYLFHWSDTEISPLVKNQKHEIGLSITGEVRTIYANLDCQWEIRMSFYFAVVRLAFLFWVTGKSFRMPDVFGRRLFYPWTRYCARLSCWKFDRATEFKTKNTVGGM